jgi:glycosyltransferase involved in cell wall biosynthesis
MNQSKKVIVLIPAYNTEKEILEVFKELKSLNKYYDEIILCDDGSKDDTIKNVLFIKKSWDTNEKIIILRHKRNMGYGAAQKTLFKYFLKRNGDIAVLIHSDNQYPPKRIKSLITPILSGKANIVLASRFFEHRNYHEEMPIHKIIGNRFLTLIENIVLKTKLTEFHTGLRAYSRDFIEQIDFYKYSNSFVFDSEVLFEAISKKYKLTEVGVFAKYEDTFSNVKSIQYGLRILFLIIKHLYKKIFKSK